MCLQAFAALFAFSLLSPVLPAAPPSQDASSTNPLESLSPLIGNWRATDEAFEKRPGLKVRWTMSHEWGPHRHLMRIYEGRHRTDPSKNILEGIIFWDPHGERLRFVAYNLPQRLLFEGHYTTPEPDVIVRQYDVHYPEGFAYIPSPELPGFTRTYRETLRFNSDGTIAQSVEIKIGDTYEPWGNRSEPFIHLRAGDSGD